MNASINIKVKFRFCIKMHRYCSGKSKIRRNVLKFIPSEEADTITGETSIVNSTTTASSPDELSTMNNGREWLHSTVELN